MTWQRPRGLHTRPRVSVVVPCYNYGHFLHQGLASILGQPGVDVDVIVVDDASPDGSAAVAHQIAESEPRVSVVVNPVNRGHIATYNEGLARATGDYVVLLSADDMLAPGALSRATALMETNTAVGFVYGWPKNFGTEPETGSMPMLGWSVWSGTDWLGHACRRGRSFIMSPEVVMRRSVLEQLGGYDPRLPHSADMDMWFRAALVAGVGRVHGPPQAFYRVHANNMHLTVYAGMLQDLRARRTTFDILFAEHADALPTGGALRAVARQALATEALRLARRELLETRGEGVDLAREFEEFSRETVPEAELPGVWTRHRQGLRLLEWAPGRVGAQVGGRVARSVAWRRWRFGGIG
jgi:hypothetical protein